MILRWWHSVLSLIGIVASLSVASVQHFIALHPAHSVVLTLAWAVVGHLVASPLVTKVTRLGVK